MLLVTSVLPLLVPMRLRPPLLRQPQLMLRQLPVPPLPPVPLQSRQPSQRLAFPLCRNLTRVAAHLSQHQLCDPRPCVLIATKLATGIT